MKDIVFKNARVVDPENSRDEMGEVYVENGKIVDKVNEKKAEVVDCEENILCPGLVDMRSFGGEPGAEHRETIKTLGNAAAAGGVTSLLMMPDTNPVIDDVALIEFVLRTAKEEAKVNIMPCAAITKGMEGAMLTEMGLLKKAGAIAFSEGRKTIGNNKIQKNALKYAKNFEALIIATTQDKELTGKGVVNAGALATRMGLAGIAPEAELIPLERDMRLVEMTNAKYHVSVISTQKSVEIIKRAKNEKVNVTAGVAIANLTLNENDVGSYRTFYKLMPPIRTEKDRMALIEGVKDGVINVICSNHDPQDADTKRHPFAQAADGAVGLETMLSASLRLHHNEKVPISRLIECMSSEPAKRLGIEKGNLSIGRDADITIFNPDEPWVVNENDLHSKSKNTAFENAQFIGKVKKTFVKGKCVFS